MGQVKSYGNILLFIFRAIGILRTNAFQVEHPYLAAQGTSGKAIYPTFSFLSHSCMANARFGFRLSHYIKGHHHMFRYVVHPDNTMTIRARRSIKQGEEITIQYISLLFGNSRRREEIKSCWFFECGCPRCSSISELGNFSQAKHTFTNVSIHFKYLFG